MVATSTAQMPLKPLVVKLTFGLRKKNLPAGNQALFPGFRDKRGQGRGQGQKRGVRVRRGVRKNLI